MPTKKEKCLGHTTQNAVGAVRTRYCDGRCNSQSESIEWESTVYIQKTCKVDYIQSIAVKELISKVLEEKLEKKHLYMLEKRKEAITAAVSKAEKTAFKAGFDRGVEEKCNGKH